MDWNKVAAELLADDVETAVPPSVQLPVLPQALQDFRKAAENPEAKIDRLAKIISSDSGLSTELLRNVNSCEKGLRREVTSVDQALVVLGVQKAMLHLTISGLRNAMSSKSSKLINFQNFWNSNLERAVFAREIAKYLDADADVAFTAGMLQDFLLPLITNQQFEAYAQFVDAKQRPQSIVAFEMESFRWNHAEAAAHIMHAWKFPPALVCCVALHHAGQNVLDHPELGKTSVAAAAVASLIPDSLRQESEGIARLIRVFSRWPGFNLGSVAKRVSEEFEEVTGKQNRYSLFRAFESHQRRQMA